MLLRSIGVVVVAGAMLAGCSSPHAVKAAVKKEKERNKAPDFTVKDADRRDVSISPITRAKWCC